MPQHCAVSLIMQLHDPGCFQDQGNSWIIWSLSFTMDQWASSLSHVSENIMWYTWPHLITLLAFASFTLVTPNLEFNHRHIMTKHDIFWLCWWRSLAHTTFFLDDDVLQSLGGIASVCEMVLLVNNKQLSRTKLKGWVSFFFVMRFAQFPMVSMMVFSWRERERDFAEDCLRCTEVLVQSSWLSYYAGFWVVNMIKHTII